MPTPRRKFVTWIVVAAIGLLVAIPVGTFVYINVIRDDAPERLDATSDTPTDALTAEPLSDVSGTWTATTGSQVGYRVKEVLFGQDTEAVGRTDKVTGTLDLGDRQVRAVNLEVDMGSVASDESRRDNQFRTRIMDVAKYPTATFKLTRAIDLPKTPDSSPFTANATGDLTLHGTTKSVQVDLTVLQSGKNVKVNGAIPIVFADWNIPNPSFGPAQTEDHGELELLVVFAKR